MQETVLRPTGSAFACSAGSAADRDGDLPGSHPRQGDDMMARCQIEIDDLRDPRSGSAMAVPDRYERLAVADHIDPAGGAERDMVEPGLVDIGRQDRAEIGRRVRWRGPDRIGEFALRTKL